MLPAFDFSRFEHWLFRGEPESALGRVGYQHRFSGRASTVPDCRKDSQTIRSARRSSGDIRSSRGRPRVGEACGIKSRASSARRMGWVRTLRSSRARAAGDGKRGDHSCGQAGARVRPPRRIRQWNYASLSLAGSDCGTGSVPYRIDPVAGEDAAGLRTSGEQRRNTIHARDGNRRFSRPSESAARNWRVDSAIHRHAGSRRA